MPPHFHSPYRSPTTYHPPPSHRPPPPPPPPPPVPVDVMCDDQTPGSPRCYFCGKRFPEADVRKTDYAVGPGQRIRVLICPACHRSRPPDEASTGRAVVVAFFAIVLAFLVLFVLFFRWAVSDAWERHGKWEGFGPKAGEVRPGNGFGP